MNALETVRNEFNFGVIKMPLSGPDNMRTPWYGLFRDDNSQSVGSGSVSERYTPHTADDVITLVECVESAFDQCEVQCHWRDGHYVLCQPTKEYRKSIFGTADNVFPRLIVRAGYDKQPFSATLGYFRDACANMSIIRAVETCHVTIRHTSGLRGKIDDLIEQFQGLRDGWDDLTSVIEGMQNRTVRLDQFMTAVYGEPPRDAGRGQTMWTNRASDILDRIDRERRKTGRPPRKENDFEVSAWEAFNGVQGFVQHSKTRHQGRQNPFDRAIFAMSDQSVVKAEQLALSV